MEESTEKKRKKEKKREFRLVLVIEIFVVLIKSIMGKPPGCVSRTVPFFYLKLKSAVGGWGLFSCQERLNTILLPCDSTYTSRWYSTAQLQWITGGGGKYVHVAIL